MNAMNTINGPVFYVSTSGVARAWLDESPAVTKLKKKKREEAARIKAVRASGRAPKECGPEMVATAPGRGAVRVFRNAATYLNADGDVETISHGVHGRMAMCRRDVFDVMAEKAAGRSTMASFTPGQIAMGRFYRDLVERHDSAGVRCSSVEAVRGGSAGGFIDAVLRDRAGIAAIRRRIGDGLALRCIRPSKRGSRVSIMDRRLVDMVCIEDQSMEAVLVAHGWCPDKVPRAKLRAALAECLDRMAGPVIGHKLTVVQFDTATPEAKGYGPVLDRDGCQRPGRYQILKKGA